MPVAALLIDDAARLGTLVAEYLGRHEVDVTLAEGEGIAPEDRGRVLEPFYRADRARTPGGRSEPARGVGLGLTLARRVAEVHGGAIAIGPAATVNGRERGCRLVITVPASPPAAG